MSALKSRIADLTREAEHHALLAEKHKNQARGVKAVLASLKRRLNGDESTRSGSSGSGLGSTESEVTSFETTTATYGNESTVVGLL